LKSWPSIRRYVACTTALLASTGIAAGLALAAPDDGGSAPVQPSAQPTVTAPVGPSADDKCEAAQKDVQVELKVIHARNTGKYIDNRVRAIQESLKRLPFNFQSYRLVKEEKVTLPPAIETRVAMPFRLSVLVAQHGLGKRSGNICLQVKIGQKQAVAVKLANGGTFLQGVTLKNGQSYILAITAKTK
jgi:hypothetical protein